jgi:hypothetical protein
MKALLTSRSDVRWAAVIVPVLFMAHWIQTSLGPHLIALVPDSVRTIFHLL